MLILSVQSKRNKNISWNNAPAVIEKALLLLLVHSYYFYLILAQVHVIYIWLAEVHWVSTTIPMMRDDYSKQIH